jgi:hypothetical protein
MSVSKSWYFFFGFYGLSITDDIWSPDNMLFGNATIAPVNINVFQESKQVDESEHLNVQAMMGIRPWRDILDVSSIPFGDLIQQPIPNSFIVVKRRKQANKLEETFDDALLRAREIAAMLTIARSHYSFSIDGFIDISGLNRSTTIGIIPYSWFDDETGKIEAKHQFYSSPWLRQPDMLSLKQLFSSHEQGTHLQTTNNRFWSIHSTDHFIASLKAYKRSSAQQRLVRAALHLYEAHHAPTPEQRLTQSVTSLEMLFSDGITNFSLLTQRLKSLLLLDATSHDKIDLIMKLRHGYVHHGDKIDSKEGDLAVYIASMTMYCFAEAVSSLGNIKVLEDRLDLIASVQQSTSLSVEERQLLLEKIGNLTKNTQDGLINLQAIEKLN